MSDIIPCGAVTKIGRMGACGRCKTCQQNRYFQQTTYPAILRDIEEVGRRQAQQERDDLRQQQISGWIEGMQTALAGVTVAKPVTQSEFSDRPRGFWHGFVAAKKWLRYGGKTPAPDFDLATYPAKLRNWHTSDFDAAFEAVS